MTMSFRSLLIGVAIVALASGCAATVDRNGDESSGGPGAAADSEDGAQDYDVIGDDDDGPIDDSGTPARSGLCPSSTFSGAADEAIAVAWSNEAVTLVMRDGGQLALPLPTEAPPGGEDAFVGVVASADRIAVTRGWNTFAADTSHATIRWFDRRGAMVDELVTDEGLSATHLTTDGVTILYRSVDDFGYVARLADGTLVDIEGIDVLGEPLPAGWMRGYDNEQGRFVLFQPSTQQRLGVESAGYPAFVDDGFAYLTGGPSSLKLVHVTPEQTTELAVADLGVGFERLAFEPVAHSSFARLIDYEDQRAWRLDWTTGETVAIDEATPAGSTLLEDDCGLTQPIVTSSGQVVSGLRTGGDAQAAVASVGGGGWQAIGQPYAQPSSFTVQEVAGSYVVRAEQSGQSFCPLLPWTEPASEDALTGNAVQLLRPANDFERVVERVDPWSILPTRDGGCVTLTQGVQEGGELVRSVIDLSQGAEPVEIEGDQFLWIP